MVLEVIYVVRHGYRMNWVVDPATGEYRTATPTPTGIPSDPALASYGEQQAEQLAAKIATLDPPVDVAYSSPFYRCLQTIKPSIGKLVEQQRLSPSGAVRVENGIGEFFGTARFEHPAPASVPVLQKHFPDMIDDSHRPSIVPAAKGETMTALHNRCAYALHTIIDDLDKDPRQPRAVLLCSHAAGLICMGRALTGRMPADWNENDFRCGTCSLSKYVRRKQGSPAADLKVESWDSSNPDAIPRIDWQNGKGILGGWDCELNGDCSFLENGEERTWLFSMAKDLDEYDTAMLLEQSQARYEHALDCVAGDEAVVAGMSSISSSSSGKIPAQATAPTVAPNGASV